MTDKLDWLNKHIIMNKYNTIHEIQEFDGYKIPDSIIEDVKDIDNIEQYVSKLMMNKEYNHLCEFLSYMLQKRVAVWWAYCCLNELMNEIDFEENETEADKKDEDDVDMELNAFQKKLNELIEEMDKKSQYATDEQINELKKIQDNINEFMQKNVPQELLMMINSEYERINLEIEKQTGYNPDKLFKESVENYEKAVLEDIENKKKPTYLEESIENINKKRNEKLDDVLKTVDFTLSKENVRLNKQRIKSAMDAVYAWIVSPDAVNSQNALLAGDAIPQEPAGMLAYSAYWSYGDLTPASDNVIKTPIGLASRGINSSITLMSSYKGGKLKPEERMEQYVNIGMEIAYGKNNWSDSVEHDKAPHENIMKKNIENISTNKRFTGE